MSVFSGDFLGFTLGDVHSSQLNITRVVASDRYDDNLIPTFRDVTMEAPGRDGMYYWDTFYTQKPFTLSFAYDDLRDEDLRSLRQLFGFKGIQPLIFDELSYKKYMVKTASPPVFKYICFDHMEMRLYKGEGSVNLVAYYPYALATFTPVFQNTNAVQITNDGDLDAELEIYYTAEQARSLTQIKLNDANNQQLSVLNFNTITPIIGDAYIRINSRTHLIEGLNSKKEKTGTLYNRYIKSGDFFEAPLGRTNFVSNVNFSSLQYTKRYY